ncbi:MAG: S41 family peptidase [Bacteroidota bacterium]
MRQLTKVIPNRSYMEYVRFELKLMHPFLSKAAQIFILSCLLVFSSCGRKAYMKALQQPISQKDLDTDAVHEDLDLLHQAIEDIVPFTYLYSDSLTIAQTYTSVKGEGQQSIMEFYGNVLELLGSYNASHFFIEFPYEQYRQKLLEQQQGIFPFYCSLENDVLHIDQTFIKADSTFKDYELIQINGFDADSLFKSFYKYVGGSKTTKHYDVRAKFHQLLWLNGIAGPFTFLFTNKQGARIEKIHQGYFYPKKPKETTTAATRVNALEDYIQYKQLDSQTACIKINAFYGYAQKEYEAFLKETFQKIKANSTTRLVIDLRGNGGGDDRLCSMLLHYLTDKPYRFYGGQHRKVSKQYNQYFRYASNNGWLLRQVPYGPGVALFFSRHPTESKTFSSPKVGKEIKLQKVKDNSLRFQGTCYFIIDNGTYSSAVSLANAVEDYNLGTLVGQPSGSIPNEHGEIMNFKLPNSGLMIYLPSAFYVRANGDITNPNPVLPKMLIPRRTLAKMSTSEVAEYIKQAN